MLEIQNSKIKIQNSPSHYRATALPHYRTIALPHYRTIALSHYRTIALSHYLVIQRQMVVRDFVP